MLGSTGAPCRALTRSIADAEQEWLLRGFGRIESRRRFKGGAVRKHVDHAEREYLFIDESGKSLPGGSGPFFAIGGIAIVGAEVDRYVARADKLKEDFFGRADVTFHEPMMRRHEGPFWFGGKVAEQRRFDRAVLRLVRETKFRAFGVGILKKGFEKDFVATGDDPYLPTDIYAVAIQMLLERYVDYRASSSAERSRSKVVFEQQGRREDALHQREFADLLLEGTQWVPWSAFQQWLETGADFTWKHGSDAMELADMLSRDLYEWIESGCRGWPGRWRLFSSRIYCRGARVMGTFGVKVFPDSDIRGRIMRHRRASGPRKRKAPAPRGGRRR